jgi:hypothetical protein
VAKGCDSKGICVRSYSRKTYPNEPRKQVQDRPATCSSSESIRREDTLFSTYAHNRNGHIPNTKVAVTAADEEGLRAILISNYSRGEKSRQNYKFERSRRPYDELKVWEAAAATSAAPTFFKPFTNPRSGQTYIDGALYYNCPAQIAWHESRLLWPALKNLDPDLLLSLGTGKQEVRQKELDSNR